MLSEQLRRLLPFFVALLAEAKKYGAYATVGCMWDYMSLPQEPYRTRAEQQRQMRGTQSMSAWYAHPRTIVLMLTRPLAIKVGNTDTSTHDYDECGWCYFERRISSLVKQGSCLWDIANFDESCSGSSFRDLCQRLKAKRPLPLSPERAEEELRRSVADGSLTFMASADFDAVADLDVIVGLYAAGFVSAINDHAYNSCSAKGGEGDIYLTGLEWGDAKAAKLAEALKYAAVHCAPANKRSFFLAANKFTYAGKRVIEEAVEGSEWLEVVW